MVQALVRLPFLIRPFFSSGYPSKIRGLRAEDGLAQSDSGVGSEWSEVGFVEDLDIHPPPNVRLSSSALSSLPEGLTSKPPSVEGGGRSGF